MPLPIPLARDNLAGLVSNSTSSSINKSERKASAKGISQSRKRIYFIYFK